MDALPLVIVSVAVGTLLGVLAGFVPRPAWAEQHPGWVVAAIAGLAIVSGLATFGIVSSSGTRAEGTTSRATGPAITATETSRPATPTTSVSQTPVEPSAIAPPASGGSPGSKFDAEIVALMADTRAFIEFRSDNPRERDTFQDDRTQLTINTGTALSNESDPRSGKEYRLYVVRARSDDSAAEAGGTVRTVTIGKYHGIVPYDPKVIDTFTLERQGTDGWRITRTYAANSRIVTESYSTNPLPGEEQFNEAAFRAQLDMLIRMKSAAESGEYGRPFSR